MTKEDIKLAANLYNARDTVKAHFKAEFKDRIKPHTELLKAHCLQNNKEVLEGLMTCLKLEVVKGNGMAEVLLIAAAVEMLEPSE